MTLRGDTVIFHAAMASGCGKWLTLFCFITGEDNVILHSTNVAYYWPLVQVSSWGAHASQAVWWTPAVLQHMWYISLVM